MGTGQRAAGDPPAQGSASQRPQTLYGPRSGHLPPAELCRWTWPSVSFGQGKKGALLKEADLSITLLCRHGAFIAFLSTSPYPFLNHNNSPPPHRPSSQETWCVLFISTDTCIQCRSPARFGDSGPGSSAGPLGGRLSLGGHQGLLCLALVLLELCVGAGGLQLVERRSGASPLVQTLRWWWEMVLLSPAILFRAGCQLPRGCQHCCASGLWAVGKSEARGRALVILREKPKLKMIAASPQPVNVFLAVQW